MSPKLSESRVIWKLAEQVCRRITRKAIGALQELDNVKQSGDDSGLINTWEEICVQVQSEKSALWNSYDLTVRQVVSGEVTRLLEHEREAVWLQTPAGEDWDAADEESREEYPVVVDDIVDYLMNEYVYSAAGDWSNPRIRNYLNQSIPGD